MGPHPGGPPNRTAQISKALSKLLRHQASNEGIKLDDQGYAKLVDVLAWNRLQSLKATLEDIKEVVASNEKQRFNLLFAPSPRPDPSDPSSAATESDNAADYRIRANQGHSIAISSEALGLTPLTVEAGNVPQIVVHGTYYAAWRGIIEKGGLSRMGRGHVHFAGFVPEAKKKVKTATAAAAAADQEHGEEQGEEKPAMKLTEGNNAGAGGSSGKDMAEEPEVKVKSGMRTDAQVLVYIDVTRALESPDEASRLKWWISANNVILSEGNSDGIVGTEWFSKIVDRKAGNAVLWERGVGEAGANPVEEVLGEWKRDNSSASKGRRGGKGGRGGGQGRGRGERRGGEGPGRGSSPS